MFDTIVSFFEELRRTFRLVDAIDILLVSVFLYAALVWFQRTASRGVLIGMAASKTGALIVVKGKEPLERHLNGGVALTGRVSMPLLFSIFDSHTPGHDGAVIIEADRVTQFAAHLPISKNTAQIKGRGTRHSAAFGLSERSDALTIVASEERGFPQQFGRSIGREFRNQRRSRVRTAPLQQHHRNAIRQRFKDPNLLRKIQVLQRSRCVVGMQFHERPQQGFHWFHVETCSVFDGE